MSFDKDKDFPVWHGGKDRALGNGMLTKADDVDGFRTQIRGDVMLRTKGGNPEFTIQGTQRAVIDAWVTPVSGKYTQGLDVVASGGGYSTPTLPFEWPYQAVAKLTKSTFQIKQYSVTDRPPGNTTWVDTRATPTYKKTLSWHAPFGGRSHMAEVGGAVGLCEPMAGRPLVADYSDGFAYAGEAMVGTPYNEPGYPTGVDYTLQFGVSNTPTTEQPWPKWGRVPSSCNFESNLTTTTALYENGVALPISGPILSAAVVYIGGVKYYRTIQIPSLPAILKGTLATRPLLTMQIVDYTAAGAVARTVPVALPGGGVYWVFQVPFFNSSGTKAAGLFKHDQSTSHPGRIYEIDTDTGAVTDLGPISTTTHTVGGTQTIGFNSYTDRTFTASGVFAVDYIGDTRVQATKTSTYTEAHAVTLYTPSWAVAFQPSYAPYVSPNIMDTAGPGDVVLLNSYTSSAGGRGSDGMNDHQEWDLHSDLSWSTVVDYNGYVVNAVGSWVSDAAHRYERQITHSFTIRDPAYVYYPGTNDYTDVMTDTITEVESSTQNRSHAGVTPMFTDLRHKVFAWTEATRTSSSSSTHTVVTSTAGNSDTTVSSFPDVGGTATLKVKAGQLYQFQAAPVRADPFSSAVVSYIDDGARYNMTGSPYGVLPIAHWKCVPMAQFSVTKDKVLFSAVALGPTAVLSATSSLDGQYLSPSTALVLNKFIDMRTGAIHTVDVSKPYNYAGTAKWFVQPFIL